nr:MAG TPA: hypothetical protein [Caudoviricetes sp.]
MNKESESVIIYMKAEIMMLAKLETVRNMLLFR